MRTAREAVHEHMREVVPDEGLEAIERRAPGVIQSGEGGAVLDDQSGATPPIVRLGGDHGSSGIAAGGQRPYPWPEGTSPPATGSREDLDLIPISRG